MIEQVHEPLYEMDAATRAHLQRWCEAQAHTTEEAATLEARVVEYLEGMPVVDAEFSMGMGWTEVVRQLGDAPAPVDLLVALDPLGHAR